MANGIYVALAGAVAQQQALDTAAHNVANASTTGFRGDALVFGEMLRQKQSAGAAPGPLRAEAYVRVEQSVLDTEGGVLKQTGNALDLGLTGDGYFVVRTPHGERLTRAGNFTVDAAGRLSSFEGNLVLGKDGNPIAIPTDASSIVVTSKGAIQADGIEVGTLSLKRVQDPATLTREGATTYSSETAAPVEAADVVVTQGYLESSNVNAFEGLDQIGDVSAAFSALMKVIDSFDQIDSRTARELGSRTA